MLWDGGGPYVPGSRQLSAAVQAARSRARPALQLSASVGSQDAQVLGDGLQLFHAPVKE